MTVSVMSNEIVGLVSCCLAPVFFYPESPSPKVGCFPLSAEVAFHPLTTLTLARRLLELYTLHVHRFSPSATRSTCVRCCHPHGVDALAKPRSTSIYRAFIDKSPNGYYQYLCQEVLQFVMFVDECVCPYVSVFVC